MAITSNYSFSEAHMIENLDIVDAQRAYNTVQIVRSTNTLVVRLCTSVFVQHSAQHVRYN